MQESPSVPNKTQNPPVSEVLRILIHIALGRTNAGRYLAVFFIRKLDNKALVITARDMKKQERKRYEKK